MTPDLLLGAALALGFGTALVAGVFQSFSDFVMRGLIAAEPAAGAAAMRMINRTVMRSVFLALLLGIAPLSIGVAAAALLSAAPGAGWLALGAGIYAAAVIGVTIFGNVPMNERLDRMAPDSAEATAYWARYGRVWTRLNHIRTIGSAAAALAFLMASLAGAGA